MTSNASEALLQWQASARNFKFGDCDISYHDNGAGNREVILMMHGFPSASWDWRHIWHDLDESYRLITLDFLGYGFSDKPFNHTYTISQQADLVQALLSSLSIEEINLFAHDIGDNVAQELLARQLDGSIGTQKIRSLALLNGGLFPEVQTTTLIQFALKSVVGKFVSKLTNQSLFSKNLAAIFGDKTKPSATELEDYWYLASFNDGHRLSHKLVHYLDERIKYRDRWVNALQALNIPMIFINGSADPVAGSRTAQRYIELIADPNIVQLSEIGHYPHTEAPELVLKHYRVFLNSLCDNLDSSN